MAQSPAYWYALILHPGYQTKWLDRNLPPCKSAIIDGFRQLFQDKYAHQEETQVMDHTTSVQPLCQSTNIALFEINYYDDLEPIEEPDEVEKYVLELVTMVRDPIAWWKDHQQQFPRLSRMALEFLSIPAMSDEIERIFSSTRLILGLRRVAMGPKSKQVGQGPREQLFGPRKQLFL